MSTNVLDDVPFDEWNVIGNNEINRLNAHVVMLWYCTHPARFIVCVVWLTSCFSVSPSLRAIMLALKMPTDAPLKL
jgi:hypothetical protein